MVTRLDRLARSLPDARDILAELTARNVRLSMGGLIHDANRRSISLSCPTWATTAPQNGLNCSGLAARRSTEPCFASAPAPTTLSGRSPQIRTESVETEPVEDVADNTTAPYTTRARH